MALATVGGAFLNVVFDRLSSPEFVNWIRGKKVDQNLLQRLTALKSVRAVLNDAEQKQITDPDVKNWLAELEDAVYVADDLLDEVSTKAAIQKGSGNFLSQSLNSEETELVTKIERIIDRLESLVKFKDALSLQVSAEDNMSSRRVPSTSLVEKSEIFGRNEDKEAIIKLLLDDTTDAKISVVSIVGIGGIGKTTLAQLVYNDDKVTEKFNFRKWVCVGEKFDVINVTKTIIQAITSNPCNTNDFDSLQTDLKKELQEKTFLIVLDDMWDDRPHMWKNLLKPFQYGNTGSKILVTTRNEKVASVNPIIPPYKLSILSDEDCWAVFLKHSFLPTKSREYATLEQIGRRIVKKCKGLPLAVETLGGLLCTKCDVKDWNDILESEIWEFSEDESMIIPALRISYHHLPSHLKRCFVYCSLFTQDHYFDKDELILLWMAEDFLQPMGKKTLEDIGCAYFNELLARSFFQPADRTITSDRYFVMHDLIHDLATFCAGEFYFRVKECRRVISDKTRHLSCNGNYPVSELLTACQVAEQMRTFVDMDLRDFNTKLISQLKFLRVLSFQSFHPLDSLPDSIGDLIYLRYLDLSHTNIVTLPESLSKLYNLQTLKLNHCEELKMLPSGMQDLVNLRHLDIEGTYLQEMPKAMSKLKHLQFLSNYIIGKDGKIRELGPLATLHRSLDISNLENLVNSDEALEARIIDKKYINSLGLSWSSDSGVADSRMEREILDKLQPHPNLRELSIEGYRGTLLSDWLGHSSYKNMTNLTLEGCGNCWKLPSLGQLPSLKHLYIADFHKLHCIDAEFYKSSESCSETPFQSLETLTFSGLRCWQEWRSLEFVNAFPQLKELRIDSCPVLIGALPDHLPALEKLHINWGGKHLDCSLPRAPAMLELRIQFKNKLRMQELPLSLPSLSIQGNELVESALEAMTHTQPTCLRQLHISHCDSAFSFPGDCLPSSLQELEISDCKKLDFPMQQQKQHDSLRKLTIYQSCDSLTSFPLNAFPNLTDLNIQGCDSALSFPGDCLPSSLQDLRIFDCKKLDFPMQQQQQHDSLRKLMISQSCDSLTSFPVNAFPSLTDLYIKGCDSALLFPGDYLPSSLQELRIYDCKKLDFPMQQHDSLRKLTIYQSCDSLTSFPLNAFPNLTDLEIWGCENIKSLVVVSQSHDTAISSLRSLKIDMCPKFVSFSTLWMAAPQLESLHIWGCPEIDSFPGGGLPPNLRDLRIRGCDKLLSCLASMDLRGHGLTRLEIGIESENVKSFPKEGWLPTSLEFLCLSLSPSLETLDCNGLSHLTSLQSLDIWFCDKLENMTGERLPASLTWLTLRRCPLLRERWRVKDPQIWSKISHIPRIDVDGRQIS